MLRWHILCWQRLWKSILLKLADLRGCKTTTKTTITTTTNDFVVRTQEEEIFGFIMYVRFQRAHEQALRGGKRKKSLQLRLWNLNICIEKNRFEMLIGGYDISNDVITLGSCLFTFALVFASRWLAEIWQLSRRGATGVLEMVFKFQSCKLSFLFPSHR